MNTLYLNLGGAKLEIFWINQTCCWLIPLISFAPRFQNCKHGKGLVNIVVGFVWPVKVLLQFLSGNLLYPECSVHGMQSQVFQLIVL